MIINIENFGKISNASIDISNYTIFVGDNNSGKTYVMQLIYGILEFLCNDIKIHEYSDFESLPKKIDDTNFSQILHAINSALKDAKDQIVNKVFHKKIPIGNINVQFKNFNQEYIIKDYEEQDDLKYNISSSVAKDSLINGSIMILKDGDREQALASISPKGSLYGLSFFCQVIIQKYLNVNRTMPSIFLPASRTGLLLLFPHFFANASENNTSNNFEELGESSENEYGFTEPVYDFMRFLQSYKPSEEKSETNRKSIDFINNKLIAGTINRNGNTITYSPNNSDIIVPAYLSSSMINEITPILQVLTSISKPKYIFYDEVETCLHPTKQIEMARLLVRLTNSGYRMIVSTHSDTMAAAINNLITLSFTNNREEKARELGYDNDDFLLNNNIHVYQFINNGENTIVSELENNINTGIGYDFSLFNRANSKLLEDATTISGDNW